MSYIKVRVDEQKLYITDSPTIAAQGVNENSVLFSFSSDWTGYGKVAHFYRDEDPETVYQSVVDASGAAPIPYEITSAAGKICLGVAGVKNDVVKTSEVLKYRIVNGLYVAETSTPEPGIYEQMLATVGQINQLQIDFETEMTERQDEYEDALDSRLDSFESSLTNKQTTFENTLKSDQATFESEIETAQTAFITDAQLQLGRVVLFEGTGEDVDGGTIITRFAFDNDHTLGEFDKVVVYASNCTSATEGMSIYARLGSVSDSSLQISAHYGTPGVFMVELDGLRNFNTAESTETYARYKLSNYYCTGRIVSGNVEYEQETEEKILARSSDYFYNGNYVAFTNLGQQTKVMVVGYASGSNINSNGWYLDENNILHLS